MPHHEHAGWYSYEEVNAPTAGFNGGWPCYEGPNLTPLYAGMNRAVCTAMYNGGGANGPLM